MSFNTPSYGDRGGGVQQLSVINEAALYKLAFRSNKPQADAFVNWVAGEVLPQLRQTGQYRIKGEAECMREQQQRQRLPLPKYRPFFEEWKQRVKPYISRNELAEVAEGIGVSYPHVRKVYAGTSVSQRRGSTDHQPGQAEPKSRYHLSRPCANLRADVHRVGRREILIATYKDC